MTWRAASSDLEGNRADVLFVSDLHLAAVRPSVTSLFLRFLQEVAPGAAALYILGDLFEYWVGDDDIGTAPNLEVSQGLLALSRTGTHIRLMHGNRDFLVSADFARAAGVELIPDPTLIDLHGVPTLLMHGDTLCTEDVAYQAFRSQVRDPAVQRAFLARPLEERRQQVGLMRAQSEQHKRTKAMDIMDVSDAAVADAFRAHGFPPRLIHGHTHRPGVHEYSIDGHRCVRWVLSDWDAAGEYLRVGAAGITRVALPPQ